MNIMIVKPIMIITCLMVTIIILSMGRLQVDKRRVLKELSEINNSFYSIFKLLQEPGLYLFPIYEYLTTKKRIFVGLF